MNFWSDTADLLSQKIKYSNFSLEEFNSMFFSTSDNIFYTNENDIEMKWNSTSRTVELKLKTELDFEIKVSIYNNEVDNTINSNNTFILDNENTTNLVQLPNTVTKFNIKYSIKLTKGPINSYKFPYFNVEFTGTSINQYSIIYSTIQKYVYDNNLGQFNWNTYPIGLKTENSLLNIALEDSNMFIIPDQKLIMKGYTTRLLMTLDNSQNSILHSSDPTKIIDFIGYNTTESQENYISILNPATEVIKDNLKIKFNFLPPTNFNNKIILFLKNPDGSRLDSNPYIRTLTQDEIYNTPGDFTISPISDNAPNFIFVVGYQISSILTFIIDIDMIEDIYSLKINNVEISSYTYNQDNKTIEFDYTASENIDHTINVGLKYNNSQREIIKIISKNNILDSPSIQLTKKLEYDGEFSVTDQNMPISLGQNIKISTEFDKIIDSFDIEVKIDDGETRYPPILTSDESIIEGITYKITSSSAQNGFNDYKAFDYNNDEGWHSESGYSTESPGNYLPTSLNSFEGKSGEWLKIKMSSAKAFGSIKLIGKDGSDNNAPSTWHIFGSNNDSTWTSIHSSTTHTTYNNGAGVTENLSNSTSYLYYAIVITNIGNSSYGESYVIIQELQFFTIERILESVQKNDKIITYDFNVQNDTDHIGTIILNYTLDDLSFTYSYLWNNVLTSETHIYTFPSKITNYNGRLKHTRLNDIYLTIDAGDGLHTNVVSEQLQYLKWKQNNNIDSSFTEITFDRLICNSNDNTITIKDFKPISDLIDIVFKIKLIAPNGFLGNELIFTIDNSNIYYNSYESDTLHIFYLWDNSIDRNPNASLPELIQWSGQYLADYNIAYPGHSYISPEGVEPEEDYYTKAGGPGQAYGIRNTGLTSYIYTVPVSGIKYNLPQLRSRISFHMWQRPYYTLASFKTEPTLSKNKGTWHTTASAQQEGISSINSLYMFLCNHDIAVEYSVPPENAHRWDMGTGYGWKLVREVESGIWIQRQTKEWWQKAGPDTRDTIDGVLINDWTNDNVDENKRYAFQVGGMKEDYNNLNSVYYNAAEVPLKQGYIYIIEIRLHSDVTTGGRHIYKFLEVGIRYWNTDQNQWIRVPTKSCVYTYPKNSGTSYPGHYFNNYSFGYFIGFEDTFYIPDVVMMSHLITDHNWTVTSDRTDVYNYLTERYTNTLLDNNILSWNNNNNLIANNDFDLHNLTLEENGIGVILSPQDEFSSNSSAITDWILEKPSGQHEFNNAYLVESTNTVFNSLAQNGNYYIALRGASLKQNRILLSGITYRLSWYEKTRTRNDNPVSASQLTVKINDIVESQLHTLTTSWVQNTCDFIPLTTNVTIEFIAAEINSPTDLNTCLIDNISLFLLS